MEELVIHSISGQEVGSEEVNAMGRGALMDDIVLAELLRLVPFDGTNVVRGILPHRYGRVNTPTVNATSTGVEVSPFRAVIGTRTAETDDATANWKDVRSRVFIGDPVEATFPLAIASNATGNPRWDLIYATVTVDSPANITRYVKNVDTSVVAPVSVAALINSSVVVGVVTGTAATTPAFPTTPADTVGPPATYAIVLAYVRVPAGYTTGGIIVGSNIVEAPSMYVQSTSTGVANMRPANGCNGYGTGLIGTAEMNAWSASGTRPPIWIQRSMNGVEGVHALIPSDVITGSVIDNTRDWRGRHFRAFIQVAAYFPGIDGQYLPTAGAGAATDSFARSAMVPLLDAGFVSTNFAPYTDGFTDQSVPIGGGLIYVPLNNYMRDGEKLNTVNVEWQVVNTHSAVPVAPTLQIVRMESPATGLTLSSGDITGVPFTGAGTVSAYDASNSVQTAIYTCNQNHIIDTTKYNYVARIVGESGSNAIADNRYFRMKLNLLDGTKAPSRAGINNYQTVGNSIAPNSSLTGAADFPVAFITPNTVNYLTAGVFGVYVDRNDGALKAFNSGIAPTADTQIFLWLEATGPVGPI